MVMEQVLLGGEDSTDRSCDSGSAGVKARLGQSASVRRRGGDGGHGRWSARAGGADGAEQPEAMEEGGVGLGGVGAEGIGEDAGREAVGAHGGEAGIDLGGEVGVEAVVGDVAAGIDVLGAVELDV